MDAQDFSNRFDVLYNNITSNQAPGLDEYEKSVFLTKAQDEIIKNYFLKQSNPKQAGFDDNQKRQADFSNIMKTAVLPMNAIAAQAGTPLAANAPGSSGVDYYTRTSSAAGAGYLNDGTYVYTLATTIPSTHNANTYYPLTTLGKDAVVFNNAKYVYQDTAKNVSLLNEKIFLIINERITVTRNTSTVQLVVKPISYEEYDRLMQKPYKYPVHYQAWRLFVDSEKSVDLVVGPTDSITKYIVRYIRTPKPIIVGNLGGLAINEYYFTGEHGGINETEGCELDSVLHEEILQRAVELAKIAWTANGQDNAQLVIQTGARSE